MTTYHWCVQRVRWHTWKSSIHFQTFLKKELFLFGGIIYDLQTTTSKNFLWKIEIRVNFEMFKNWNFSSHWKWPTFFPPSDAQFLISQVGTWRSKCNLTKPEEKIIFNSSKRLWGNCIEQVQKSGQEYKKSFICKLYSKHHRGLKYFLLD